MLRTPHGARRYNDPVLLTYAAAQSDAFAHADIAEAEVVGEVYAEVRQMSATKTMMTFQRCRRCSAARASRTSTRRRNPRNSGCPERRTYDDL